MAAIVPRNVGFICRSCRTAQLTQSSIRQITNSAFTSSRQTRSTVSQHRLRRQTRNASTAIPLPSRATQSSPKAIRSQIAPSRSPISNPSSTLQSLQHDVARIISASIVPEELAVLELLDRLYQFSNIIVFGQTEAPEEVAGAGQEQEDTAASTLRDLEESSSSTGAVHKLNVSTADGLSLAFRSKAADTLCELVYNLVKDPKVFISPAVLQVYTRIQCLLGRPEYLPEIFHLYAHKPLAQPKTSPIKYSNPSPNSPKNAIPIELSDAALNAAIYKRDLPLALAVIDTTVATKAFRRNRVLRKASLPFAFISATPVIAWAGADWVARWQDVWDVEMARWTAMAGALAYVGTLTTIGFVAVTTWNDHHIRVAWRVGTPLRQRWLREDERAYFDRVAMAWGFQKKHRRGEEQGEEWESLREVIGLRSMVLDNPSLMEGME